MLANDCAELGIPHPAFRRDPPSDPENWVVKAVGGAGGSHIARANGDPPAAGRYFQRFVSGRSVSALFIGDGNSARIVGFSRQWLSPAPAAPYRYGGAVRLRRFDRSHAARIGRWLSGLTQRAGLVGLCSADFIRDANGYQLIEINPRPGATLDIFDSSDAPLMEAHLRAARGEPYRLPRFADSMASMITYAAAPVPQFPAIDWPDWTADHQSPGTRLIAGDPVCTVFARGPSAGATRAGGEDACTAIAAPMGGRPVMKDGSAFLNDNAQRIADGMIRDAERLRIAVSTGPAGRNPDRCRLEGHRRHRSRAAHGRGGDGRPRQHFGGRGPRLWRNGRLPWRYGPHSRCLHALARNMRAGTCRTTAISPWDPARRGRLPVSRHCSRH